MFYYCDPFVAFDLMNGRHLLVVPVFALHQVTIGIQMEIGLFIIKMTVAF
jgi:hypothetical protein